MRSGILCILSMIFVCGCGPDDEADPPEGHPDKHVFLWVDSISGLPEEAMLKGCDSWLESGVGCDIATDIENSDVQIFADMSACTPDADGVIVLAYAVGGGSVIFFPECFKFQDGSWDTKALAIVAAHEIGHQFGLWWHVSKSCTNAPMHPSGESVCGTAVMNPYYNSSVDSPTDIDALAFDIRNTALSVVDAYNHHAHEIQEDSSLTCVFTKRP